MTLHQPDLMAGSGGALMAGLAATCPSLSLAGGSSEVGSTTSKVAAASSIASKGGGGSSPWIRLVGWEQVLFVSLLFIVFDIFFSHYNARACMLV